MLEVPEPHSVHRLRMDDGYTVALRRHGNPDGPRLVLSHGNGFAVDAYWPFWSHFLDRFDLFLFDIRSHGWNAVGDLDAHHIGTAAVDFGSISREIDRAFGGKPKVGVFHSLASMAALHAAIDHEYEALLLFDPPLNLPGKEAAQLERLGSGMGAATRKRRERFGTVTEYAEFLADKPAFELVGPEGLELFARTTLRPAVDGGGYELRCPRDHEAQLWDELYPFARTIDFAAITCPVKVIGSDPTLFNSFLPATVMPELLRLDYDFVPDTTHLLLLEQPDVCAAYTLEYLEQTGNVER